MPTVNVILNQSLLNQVTVDLLFYKLLHNIASIQRRNHSIQIKNWLCKICIFVILLLICLDMTQTNNHNYMCGLDSFEKATCKLCKASSPFLAIATIVSRFFLRFLFPNIFMTFIWLATLILEVSTVLLELWKLMFWLLLLLLLLVWSTKITFINKGIYVKHIMDIKHI